MNDQKAENLLNLALSVPEEERSRTEELDVGYDRDTRTWELIVKYSGDLAGAVGERFPEAELKELSGGFGILRVPEDEVPEILGLKEIEYAEKPKRLFFAINQAEAASCLTQVQQGPEGLTGRGVLVGILDSGIDYFHGDFRHEDGASRILFLKDQVTGSVYTKEEIDEALRTGSREAARALVPSSDPGGHGTAVAGIAAGNGRESGGRYRGVAYESDILAVRLGTPEPDGFPRTTQVMEGLDFLAKKSMELGRPMAVNVSFGNSYGSHDGTELLERFMDSLALMGRMVFVAGMGNEGDAGGHTSGRLSAGSGSRERPGTQGTPGTQGQGGSVGPLDGGEARIQLSVAPYESGFGVQLWKSYEDTFEITLSNPGKTVTERISSRLGPYEIDMGGARVLLYYGEPGPFSLAQEVYFDFLPPGNGESGQYVESGIWEITLKAEEIVDGRYDLWLPSGGILNRSTRFLRPTPETTLTIPSTAMRPISVGAYDDTSMTYAPFSGRGDTRQYGIQKPDLAAPGVGIVAARSGGGYAPVTGTSFAAPFVTGAAALLMEWGIVRGNDPYLYGDKVKAYLRRGAKKLPGEQNYPNPRVGYGALCVRDSLPL
ncbi:MAG: S8 family peptidase [Sakamotonia sp.]|jgi:minor extracellular serine protease Vpr